jgi:hypothetical protein
MVNEPLMENYVKAFKRENIVRKMKWLHALDFFLNRKDCLLRNSSTATKLRH